MRRAILQSIAVVIFACVSVQSASPRTNPPFAKSKAKQNLSQFLGRYTDGEEYVIYFEQTKYGMTLRPVYWTATQILEPSGTDEFVVVDRRERGATFHRDETGRVVAVTIRGMEGEGKRLTRAGRQLLPVELFLAGNGRAAARRYLANGVSDSGRLIRIAEIVLERYPSKPLAVINFLSELSPVLPGSAASYSLLGYAYVAAGNRKLAATNFRRAYRLDPANKQAISGLARLNLLPGSFVETNESWKLPFQLSSVFAKPTAAEIREVEEDWRKRDLSPRDIVEVATGPIQFGSSTANVRIVSHTVLGSRHYGAIITPSNPKPGCCPVIVEAKGVSWNYFPLNLDRLNAPMFMGNSREQFIYVLPSFRGEVLEYDGKSYQSEGDRTDALDGATDDAIALLNVALQTTPSSDASKICVFGRSRGGTVALLMGIRDPRIRCVVEWAGPTDWFELMGTDGWTTQEIYGEGLRTRASPSQTGGQDVERFLLKAINGEQDIKAVRRRMLASSPLYFAQRLPPSEFHYGGEDTSVPVRNGYALVAELKRKRVPTSRYQDFFYPKEGHDTDRINAPLLSREFILKSLKLN